MILYRIAQSDATYGVLVKDGKPLCVTLEDPWNDNQRRISCIPEGEYDCIPHSTNKYPKVWEVTKVPNRTAILIHAGNTTDDTEGCILVGKQFGQVNGKYGIINSGIALNHLREILPSTFKLKIINCKET